MLKNKIIVVLVFVALLLGTPAWANKYSALAEAAYKARIAEKDANNKKAAEKIRTAVLNAKKNPAQAAYNARVAEKNMDKNKPNNPADIIYRAVINTQAEDAAKVVNKLKQPERDGLGTIITVLGNIPETKATKPIKDAEKFVGGLQIAVDIKRLVDASDKYKKANSETEKQRLRTDMANISLDLIDKAAGNNLGNIYSSLVSTAVAGSKNLIKAVNYRNHGLDLVIEGMGGPYYGIDEYAESEYREIVIILIQNKVPYEKITNAVNGLIALKNIK